MLTVAQQHAASGRRASICSLDDTWSMFVEGSGGSAATAGAAPNVPTIMAPNLSSPAAPLTEPCVQAVLNADFGDVGHVMFSTHAEDGDEDDVSASRPMALRVNVDAAQGRAAAFPPITVGWRDSGTHGENAFDRHPCTSPLAPKELWHEVTVQPFVDPTTGEAALLLTQSDATGRAKTEETLSKMVEVSVGPWGALHLTYCPARSYGSPLGE